jgi:hypothetical protein
MAWIERLLPDWLRKIHNIGHPVELNGCSWGKSWTWLGSSGLEKSG